LIEILCFSEKNSEKLDVPKTEIPEKSAFFRFFWRRRRYSLFLKIFGKISGKIGFSGKISENPENSEIRKFRKSAKTSILENSTLFAERVLKRTFYELKSKKKVKI
jgi:hypothetical protein